MATAPAAQEDDGRAPGGLVCVTGGSGFIGSWLVRLLLGRGYTVHATVNNLQDDAETGHLRAMDGADARLRLFQMDLLDPASVRPAVEGVRGVFHLASPVILQPAHDPENELLQPAVDGTLNVLRAARDCSVRRVVLVSSQVAMVPNPAWPADKVIDEDSWADVEILKKLQLWYNVSKTLAEKAAWHFAGEEEGLQLVVLNPALVLGPTLTPAATPSLRVLMQLLGGQRLDMEPYYVGFVDVRDVAQSLLLLYENPSAQGRHLCLESTERLVDFIEKLANLYPEFPVHRIKEDKQDWVVRSKVASKKLIDLGVRFTPFDKTIRDTVDCLRSKGEI
uniref:Uncharacterized protein n=1 Tax=Avena sativa TaxID=4498 RepID=A0ACD5W3V0_AVESA